jgi:hypothetical protein
MKIRRYDNAIDAYAIKAMHSEQGFEYPLPSEEEIASFLVVADGENRPIMAVAARRTVEMYFLVGSIPGMTPGEKVEAFKAIHETMRLDLQSQGFTDVNCFIPPSLCRGFVRRLKRMFGWREASEGPGGEWLPMTRQI